MTFNKRIFDVPGMRAATYDVVSHMSDLRRAAQDQKISKAFAERIMLAVTAVNGCRYCAYAHTRMALQAGLSEAEVQQYLSGDLDHVPAEEAVALVFAQHYAESAGQPDPATWGRVVETYGPDQARQIMAYIRMIMYGNLLGNTFDALLSRFKGSPAPDSSLTQETGVLLGSVMVLPVELVRYLWHRRRNLEIGG